MPANGGLGAWDTWVSIWLHLLTSLCPAVPYLSEPQFPPVGNSFTPCSPFRDLGKGLLCRCLGRGRGALFQEGKGCLGHPVVWLVPVLSKYLPSRFSGGPSHRGPPTAGRVRELPGRGSALARGQITPSARTEMQRRCGFGAQVIADG